MRPNNPILLNAVTNAGTVVSAPAMDISFMTTGSVQVTFTDVAAAGTFLLQASNDPVELLPGGEQPLHWSTIPNTSTSVTAGASQLITVQTLNYKWFRVHWVSSAGAGTLTATGFFQGEN